MANFANSAGERGLDPSSFQISAVMVLEDGIRIPLWTKGTSGGANEAFAQVQEALGGGSGLAAGGPLSSSDLLALDLPVVESISIELSLGLVGKVTVDIATTYDTGLRLMDSPFFHVGNIIEVQLGYQRSQRYTPWVSAITAAPSIRISADEGMNATLNGEGGAFPALRGVSNKVFQGKSYREIIQEIASVNSWDVDLPEVLGKTLDAELLGGSISGADPFDLKRETVSQGQMTDWFFIQHICYGSGCNMYMGPTAEKGSPGKFRLVVKRRRDSFAAQPRVKFVSRGKSDFITIFPLLEFETEPVFVWLPGGAVKTTTQDVDHDDKKVQKHDATAETSGETVLNDAGSPTSAKKTVDSAEVSITSTDGADRTGDFLVVSSRDPRRPSDVAQSHRDELAIRGGVTAKGTSFGIPELLPGDVVQLDEIGIFNGLYGINSLTHTANDTEWSMTMELLNNASASGIFQKFFVKPPDSGKANTSNADEIPPDSGGSTDVEPES